MENQYQPLVIPIGPDAGLLNTDRADQADAHRSRPAKATVIREQFAAILAEGSGALRQNWLHYLCEMLGLAGFLLVAGAAVSVFFASASPLSLVVTSDVLRRLLVGLIAASYLIALIYSPLGRASGAHINPAITLAFFRLGKIKAWDLGFYILAQFTGAVIGVSLFALILGSWASDPNVNYILTVPGAGGIVAAFFAEIAITFTVMSLVLRSTNNRRLAPYTGLLAGALLAVLILTVAPISGTSLNPARSFGSASVARDWTALWLYFVAPPIGALLATVVYRWPEKTKQVICAKFYHSKKDQRCIFINCGYKQMTE